MKMLLISVKTITTDSNYLIEMLQLFT